MKYEKLSKDILKYIGGEENIIDYYKCVTRLRINVKDKSKVDMKNIEKNDLVQKVQYKGNELQVVIGAKVNEIFQDFERVLDNSKIDKSNSTLENKDISTRVVDFLGGIFVPVLPALIAGGMLKSIITLLMMANWISPQTDIAIFLNIIADSVFYFLPFFLAVTSARVIKTNEMLAIMVAGGLMYPTLINGLQSQAKFLYVFSLSIPVMSYATTVFPIIFGVLLLKYVHKFFEKIIPENLRTIFSPLLTIIITLLLTLAFLAPLGSYLGSYLAKIINAIFNFNGVIASIVIGGLLPLIVMAGMHQSLFPIMLNNLSETGSDVILPLFYLQTLAIAGAVMAVFFVTNNKKIKSACASTGITAFLGITEPALYGIVIPKKKPLVAALIASGIAGGLGNFLGIRAFSFAMPSILSIPTYYNPQNRVSLLGVFIASVVSFVLSFILSYIFMKSDNKNDEIVESKIVEKDELIYSPLENGKSIDVLKVNDDIFSKQILGPSVAIKPLDGKLFAPVDGVITMIADTKHAIGISTKNGLELLIHIGVDTVKLGGEPFDLNVKEGDEVKRGDLLAYINLDFLRKNCKEDTIIMAVTNVEDIDICIPEDKFVNKDSLVLRKIF